MFLHALHPFFADNGREKECLELTISTRLAENLNGDHRDTQQKEAPYHHIWQAQASNDHQFTIAHFSLYTKSSFWSRRAISNAS